MPTTQRKMVSLIQSTVVTMNLETTEEDLMHESVLDAYGRVVYS